MLAVVPQITTARLDGPANPITPVVTAPAAPQTTDPPAAAAANTPDASNIATSPSTSAAPSPSKKNSKSGATAGGAGTASTAAPLTAVGSQDSILGSWSTLSIPKSSAGTATKDNGGKAASRKSKGNSSPQPTTTSEHGPSTPVPPMTAATTGSFLAPKSRSKSRKGKDRLHSNSAPTAPRMLMPEPAPPPPSALNNKPLKPPQRLSNSSKDRRRKHNSAERRQSTPYPLAAAMARRQRLSSGPLPAIYPSETGGSENLRPSPIVRRPSPVPPSSSHSDSSRSSDSYVSLKEGAPKTTAGPPPSRPLPARPSMPQLSSTQNILPSMTPKPSLHLLAALRSQAQSPLRLPPPTPGLPRIFHPSPLNPNPPPPSPYNAYQPIPRFSPLLSRHPGRHAHIVPLPSLTYPSVQQLPRALPQSEIEDLVWTPTQTGMEEYASDHPQDLRQRAIEMEARDELERVRIWSFEVFRDFLPNKNEERIAGEEGASAGGDDFFLLEKPPKIDLESLTPHRSQDSATGEIPVLVPYTLTDEERAAKDRALPKVPAVAVAAPTPDPDSLVPFPTLENGRMASPYPAPPDNHVVHLDSSSASSQMGADVPHTAVPADITPDPAHLAPPLSTQKSFVSLTTPSPFGLPSPLRLPIMQTPMTPFYSLGSGNNGDLATPPAQEPLPPILEPEGKQTPDVIPVHQVQRVPSALEHASSYLGSALSRAPSPETPPRIIHSSNSRREDEEQQVVTLPSRTRTRSRSTSSDSLSNNPWKRVRSADSGSTISRAFTKTSRGRSPTRRSWKAASERAAVTSSHGLVSATRVSMVMQRIDGTERVTVMQPVLVSRLPTTGAAAGARAAGSAYSWHLSSVGDENDRPRTASRSSRSRYSATDDAPRAPTAVELRPETQLSVVTNDLFYKPQATPIEEKAPAQNALPVVEQPKTAKPVEVRKEAQMLTLVPPPIPNRPSGVSPSVLRRRKSHRARQSVVSLPASGDEREASREAAEQDPTGKTKPEKPPVMKVKVPTFAEVLPAALRTSFPSATSVPFNVSPATSKAVQPLLPLVRPAFHSPAVSSPASATASAPVHSLLFNKLVVLIAQFNSDLSLGRNKVPRWKRDFAEMDDKVRMVYDAFAGAVERSRVEFRPWMREHHNPAEEEEGKTVMYVDDLWERIATEVSARGNLSAQTVQEDIIRSVTSSWDVLASECLNGVREVLSQLVTSIVDLHFRCAGDGNELRMIVQSIADGQLHNQVEMTGRKLADFGALEKRTVFTSSHARLRDSAAAILSHFKDIRRQADHTLLEPSALRQSPVPMGRTEAAKASSKPLDHVVPVAGPSHSRESHTMSIPSSFTGQTSSLFSKNVPLSTVATSEDQGRQSDGPGGLRRRLVEQQRQRADSLRNANEAIQVALSSLRSVGFHDLSSPEQLLEKLVEPDPVDEVLEIMANVVAYLDIASIRFVDYITLHIEDYLVNAIGDKINAAVVANLDLSGANIEERCLRWMAA